MDMIDIALYSAYILTILGGLAAIIFPIVKSISNPKSIVKAIIGLGALIVIFGISWLISGDEVLPTYLTHGVTQGLSRFVGALLTMMYILIGSALLGIVYTEVSKAIK